MYRRLKKVFSTRGEEDPPQQPVTQMKVKPAQTLLQ